jgi:hypothetical protein
VIIVPVVIVGPLLSRCVPGVLVVPSVVAGAGFFPRVVSVGTSANTRRSFCRRPLELECLVAWASRVVRIASNLPPCGRRHVDGNLLRARSEAALVTSPDHESVVALVPLAWDFVAETRSPCDLPHAGKRASVNRKVGPVSSGAEKLVLEASGVVGVLPTDSDGAVVVEEGRSGGRHSWRSADHRDGSTASAGLCSLGGAVSGVGVNLYRYLGSTLEAEIGELCHGNGALLSEAAAPGPLSEVGIAAYLDSVLRYAGACGFGREPLDLDVAAVW